jgi:hypothetical protein
VALVFIASSLNSKGFIQPKAQRGLRGLQGTASVHTGILQGGKMLLIGFIGIFKV